jgi:hypothetical protein
MSNNSNYPQRLANTYLGEFTNDDYSNFVKYAIKIVKERNKLGLIFDIDDNAFLERAKEFKDLGLQIKDGEESRFFIFDKDDPKKLEELEKRAIALFKAVTYAESDSFFSIVNQPASLDMIVRIEHENSSDLYQTANPSTSIAFGTAYGTYEAAFNENSLAAKKSTSFGLFQIIPGRYSPSEDGFKKMLNNEDFNEDYWGSWDSDRSWELLLGTSKLKNIFSGVTTDRGYVSGDENLRSVPGRTNWNLYSLAVVVGNYFFQYLNNEEELQRCLSSLWYAYVPMLYNFWGVGSTIKTLDKDLKPWPENYHNIHNNGATFNEHVGKLNATTDIKQKIDSGQWPKVGRHDSFGVNCCLYNSKLLWAFIQFYNNPDLVTLRNHGGRSNRGVGGNQHVTTTVITNFGAIGKIMRDSMTQHLTNPLYSTINNRDEKDNNEFIKNEIAKSIYSYVNAVYFDSSLEQKIDASDGGILPLNVTMTIDGISGLNVGDAINVDFLPQIYYENTYLIIIGLSYEIGSSNSWLTHLSLGVKLKGKKYDK